MHPLPLHDPVCMTPTTSSSGDSHGDALPDAVVSAALDAYARLPKHGKPARRDNGVSEWTVFASILLTAATAPPSPPSTEPAPASACAPPPLPRIIPISLATGVKCLPAARLPPLGDTLHDSHAEVLARRGFVRWLVDEAGRVLRAGREGTEERGGEGVMELRDGMFRLKAGVEVWLYVSALPVSPSVGRWRNIGSTQPLCRREASQRRGCAVERLHRGEAARESLCPSSAIVSALS